MLFMIIERFRKKDCSRFANVSAMRGEGCPKVLKTSIAGSNPISTVVSADAAQRSELLQAWFLEPRGLGTTLEIVPVLTNSETREVVAPALDAI